MKKNTNNKTYTEAVKGYIMYCIPEGETVESVAKSFKVEAGSPQEIKYHKSVQGAFTYWLGGLPTSLNIDFSQNDVENVLNEWGATIDRKPQEFNDDSWEFFLNKIFVVFTKMYKEETGNDFVSYILQK